MKAVDASIEYLRPYIEIEPSYAAGRYSKGYRWNDHYSDEEAVEHVVSCPRFKLSLERHDQRVFAAYGELEAGVADAQKAVTIAAWEIESVIQSLPPKPEVCSETHRKNCLRYEASKIQMGEMGHVKLSSNNGRIYCSVNRLSSALRKILFIDGVEVVELDLASSQLYFLTALFPSKELIEAVKAGEFYQRVNEQMRNPVSFLDPVGYTEFKKSILAALFVRVVNGCQYWKHEGSRTFLIIEAMEKAYPGLPRFLAQYREAKGPTALAIELQRMESDVMVKGVVGLLQREGEKVIPIHDAIMCRETSLERVKEEMREQLIRRVGIDPKIRGGRERNIPYVDPFSCNRALIG